MHTRWHTYPPKEEQVEQSLTKKSLSDFIPRRSVDPLYKLIKEAKAATTTTDKEKQWLSTIEGYFDTYASAIMKITRPKMWKSEYALRNDYIIEYGEPSPSEMRIVMARLLTYEELYTESMRARMSLKNESFDYDFIWKPPKQAAAEKIPDSNGNYNYLQHSHWLSPNNPKDVYFVSKINCGFDPKNHWGLYMADLPGTDSVSFRMACCKERVGQSEGCWIRLDDKQQEGVVLPYLVMPKNYWEKLADETFKLNGDLATKFNNNVQKGTAFRDTDKYVQLDSKILSMWKSVTTDLEAAFKTYITELDKIYESAPPGQLPLNPSASLEQGLRQRLISVLELEQQYNEVQGYKPTHDWNSYMDLYLFKVSQIRDQWTEEKRGGIMIGTRRIPFLRANMSISDLDVQIIALGTSDLGNMWTEYRNSKERLEFDEDSYKMFKQSEYVLADYAGDLSRFMTEYESFQKILETDTIKVKEVMKKLKGNIPTNPVDYIISSTTAPLTLLKKDDIDKTIENQQVRILKDELPKLKSTSDGDLDETKYASAFKDRTFITNVITEVAKFKTKETPPNHKQLPAQFEASNLKLIDAYNQIYINKEKELADEIQKFRNILVQLEKLATKYSSPVYNTVGGDLNYGGQIDDINTNIQKIQRDIDNQRTTTANNFDTIKTTYDNALTTFQNDITKIDMSSTVGVTARLNGLKTTATSLQKFNTNASRQVQESIDKLIDIRNRTDMSKNPTAYNTAWAYLKTETPNLLQSISSLALDDTNLQTLLDSFKTIIEGVDKIYSDNKLYKETDDERKQREKRERLAELQRRRDLVGADFQTWINLEPKKFIQDAKLGFASIELLFSDYKATKPDFTNLNAYGLVKKDKLVKSIVTREYAMYTLPDTANFDEIMYIGDASIDDVKLMINSFVEVMIHRDMTKFKDIVIFPPNQLTGITIRNEVVRSTDASIQIELKGDVFIPRGLKWVGNSCWIDTVFLALFGTPEGTLTNEIWRAGGIQRDVVEFTFSGMSQVESYPLCDDVKANEMHFYIKSDIISIQSPDITEPKECLTPLAFNKTCSRRAFKMQGYGSSESPLDLIQALKTYYPNLSMEYHSVISYDYRDDISFWDNGTLFQTNNIVRIVSLESNGFNLKDELWTSVGNTLKVDMNNYTITAIIYAVQNAVGEVPKHYAVHINDFVNNKWYLFDRTATQREMKQLTQAEIDIHLNDRFEYNRQEFATGPKTVLAQLILTHLVFVRNDEIDRLTAKALTFKPAPQIPGTSPAPAPQNPPQVIPTPAAPTPQNPAAGPPQVITETLLQISDDKDENTQPLTEELYTKLYSETIIANISADEKEALKLNRKDVQRGLFLRLNTTDVLRSLLHIWWVIRTSTPDSWERDMGLVRFIETTSTFKWPDDIDVFLVRGGGLIPSKDDLLKQFTDPKIKGNINFFYLDPKKYAFEITGLVLTLQKDDEVLAIGHAMCDQ